MENRVAITRRKEYPNMNRKRGFTLVELLVVIAIISILAAIVVPNVQSYLLRARMTQTFSEIESIETSLTKLLTDANKDNLRQLFTNAYTGITVDANGIVDPGELEVQIGDYTKAIYELLRQGRTADTGNLQLDPLVRGKLGQSYLALDLDSWDKQYQFWVPPVTFSGRMPFRAYRAGTESPDGTYYPYIYSDANTYWSEADNAERQINRETEMDQRIPGNPNVDDLPGYPARRDLGVYIFSYGVNGINDQSFGDPEEPRYEGGGDDINNWDKQEQGWTSFYS